MLIQNDCLIELKKLDNECIDMVYLDPPFFTQKDHASLSAENELLAFSDSWDSILDYIQYIKERLYEIKRVLKKSGSIFFHCDKAASHHIRLALDEVFGYKNFQSEIIWTYKRWSNSKTGLLNSHQNIFFYSKSKDFKFHTRFTDYSPTTNVDQILQQRERTKLGKCVYKKKPNGEIESNVNKKGVPLCDVWNIPFLNPKAKERTGYPTQKPIELLERIIDISTDKDDTILDPFCGSGTTLVAAKLNGRNYIGFDISQKAIEIAKNRLDKPFKTESQLLKHGIKKYQNKTIEEQNLLKSIGAIIVQRNSGIDGFIKDDDSNNLIAVKLFKGDESIHSACQKLIKAANSKGCEQKILIKIKKEKTLSFFDADSLNEVKIIDKNDLVTLQKKAAVNL